MKPDGGARETDPARAPLAGDHPVVLFDGFCVLCSSFAGWLIAWDRHRHFRLAALQSEAGAAFWRGVVSAARASVSPGRGGTFPGTDPGRGDDAASESILLVEDGVVYERSEAVLRIAYGLGGVWRGARLLLLIPRSWRDAVYRFIARRRYGWFGRRDECRLPTEEERSRFLG